MPKKRTTIVKDFRRGLDTRRSILTSFPGAMVTLENCHINQGGEIQKRFAFLPDPTQYHANSFGLEAVAGGLVTFCSLDPSAWTAPAGVTYQRLRHPADLYGGTSYAMTGIVFSLNFNGNAFACAQFADGNTFLYYNGVLIEESWEGTVLAGRTSTTVLAADVARAVARQSGWQTTAAGAFATLYSPSLLYFTPLASWQSTLGLIGLVKIDVDGPGTTGTSASAAFSITTNGVQNVDTVTVKVPANATNTVQFTICNAQVAGNTAASTAANIVAQINNLTSATGYYATVTAATVSVYAPVTFGNLTANLEVDWTGGTFVIVVGAAGGNLQASISGNQNVVQSGHQTPRTVGTTINATVSGGTGPYSYAWSDTDTSGITITPSTAGGGGNPPAGIKCGFSKSLAFNTVATGSFKLVVTDSLAATSTVFFSISLEYDSLN